MPSLRTVRAENANFSPKCVPVAIFVGGTSGVGQGMVQAFAKYTKGNAHIIIIGRNKDAADSIISTFPKPTSPSAKHEFIQADISLMANIHSTTSQLLSTLPKINFLIMSPGILSLSGRNETSEGIDKKLALHYYARFAFTHDLLPLLKKAEESGEDAKVYSVLGAGTGTKIDMEDLGLKKTFSVSNALQAISYHDAAFKEFSLRHPSNKLTFAHSYPGTVATGLLKNSDTGSLRFLNNWVLPVFTPLFTSLEDAGEFQLYGMLNHTGGFKRIGAKGEDIGNKQYFTESEDVRKKVWEHSLKECRIEGV
ncbi:NAD(P)-binding protein [Flagelloscypha sp. PMI_526]|nr:NAD(P)-binding protein [Flagelloscypha sp. PMI_526]